MAYAGRNNIYDAVIRRRTQEALDAQDLAFEREHAQDTDAQLLCYLAHCINDLGCLPQKKEIVGGGLIEKRFGSWQAALAQSGIDVQQGRSSSKSTRAQQERVHQELLYRQQKAEKAAKRKVRGNAQT